MAIKHESDSLNTGYCEYLTKVNASSAVILARIMIILFTAVLIAAMLAVTLKTIPVVGFMLGALIVFMAWFVFQFTKIEYEYEIATGEFTLSKIYGARTRREVLSFKTADIITIAPESALDSLKADNIIITCRKSDINRICILYTETNGKKQSLVISAPDKTVSCLKYYKRSAFTGF